MVLIQYYFSVFMTTGRDGVVGILQHIAVGGVILDFLSLHERVQYICSCDCVDEFIPRPEGPTVKPDMCVSICSDMFSFDERCDEYKCQILMCVC